MACHGGTNKVEDGLLICLDAANPRSYSGIGTKAKNLVFSREIVSTEPDTDITWSGDGFSYVSVGSGSSLGFGPSDVKGESDSIGQCSGLVTFEQALQIAHDAGYRLPTIDEVRREAATGSGCGYDGQYIWTADPVPGTNGAQHYVVYGRMEDYGYDAVGRSNTSTAYMRYVGDVNVNRTDPSIIIDDPFLKSWLENYYSNTISTIPNSSKNYSANGITQLSTPTLYNGTGWENGYFVFDGTNDYISLNKTFISNLELPTGDTSYSIEAWVWIGPNCNPGITTAGAGIIGNNGANGIGLQLTGDGSVIYANFGLRSNNNFDSISTLQKETWYHIVGSRKAGELNRLYINGVLDGSLDQSQLDINLPFANEDMRIGDITGRLSEPFEGRIGSVSIYRKGLTAEEVNQNFQALRGRYGL